MVHTWAVGRCIVCTRIRLLLLIHPFIFSFFFLSNFQTVKNFVTLFIALKGTHFLFLFDQTCTEIPVSFLSACLSESSGQFAIAQSELTLILVFAIAQSELTLVLVFAIAQSELTLILVFAIAQSELTLILVFAIAQSELTLVLVFAIAQSELNLILVFAIAQSELTLILCLLLPNQLLPSQN